MTSFAIREPFVLASVTPAQVAAAHEMRRQRDAAYANIFAVEASDERWVGDLGEIIVDAYLTARRGAGYEWLVANAAGQPDFVLPPAVRVGVKTVKRQVGMQPHYTAQITARHALEPIDHFFFLSYEVPKQRMWLLGGIAKRAFLAGARLYTAGEHVHSNYVIRPGHEIYNIGVSELGSPDAWLSEAWPAPAA